MVKSGQYVSGLERRDWPLSSDGLTIEVGDRVFVANETRARPGTDGGGRKELIAPLIATLHVSRISNDPVHVFVNGDPTPYVASRFAKTLPGVINQIVRKTRDAERKRREDLAQCEEAHRLAVHALALTELELVVAERSGELLASFGNREVVRT